MSVGSWTRLGMSGRKRPRASMMRSWTWKGVWASMDVGSWTRLCRKRVRASMSVGSWTRLCRKRARASMSVGSWTRLGMSGRKRPRASMMRSWTWKGVWASMDVGSWTRLGMWTWKGVWASMDEQSWTRLGMSGRKRARASMMGSWTWLGEWIRKEAGAAVRVRRWTWLGMWTRKGVRVSMGITIPSPVPGDENANTSIYQKIHLHISLETTIINTHTYLIESYLPSISLLQRRGSSTSPLYPIPYLWSGLSGGGSPHC